MSHRFLIEGRFPPAEGDRFADDAVAMPAHDTPLLWLGEPIGRIKRSWVENGELYFEAEVDEKFLPVIKMEEPRGARVIKRVSDDRA